MEEALERKRQDTVVSTHTHTHTHTHHTTHYLLVQKPPLSYFPWGQNSPRRDDSGKLLSRRQPRPPPPQNEVSYNECITNVLSECMFSFRV